MTLVSVLPRMLASSAIATVAVGAVLGAIGPTALPSQAAQLNFNRVYFFGDSLSDPGNVFQASGQTFPPSPFYDTGHFSNGLTWAEYLAQDLGLQPAKLTDIPFGADPSQGINFAFGGARTNSQNTTNAALPGLLGELGAYQDAQFQGFATPKDALYVLWLGANDYLGGGVTNPAGPLANIAQAIDDLAGLGAKNFLIGNLPDLGSTPLAGVIDGGAPGSKAGLSQITQAHNAGLQALLNQRSNLNIQTLDVNSLFAKVVAQPSPFGFQNVTSSCVGFPTTSLKLPSPTCGDTNLFWDDLHPTTKTHRLIADDALVAVHKLQSVPEPGLAGAIALVAVSGLWRGWRKRQVVEI
jgi:phospholipase/lecithinase/hemolysin